jgi:pimeloyl-ACP methyl ester carboxylesterase
VEDGFELIIAHSMGVLATFAALRQGARARAVAAIAGPFNMEYILSVAIRVLHLTDPAAARLREKIAHRFLEADIRQWTSTGTSVSGDMPLLIIHDQDDNDIEPSQADLIAKAHKAATHSVMTKGLGHYSILADSDVLQYLRGFAADVDVRPNTKPTCEDEPPARLHMQQ